MEQNIEMPELPVLRRRPDGNWKVVLVDDPKGRTYLAGDTMIKTEEGFDWVFVSELAASNAALGWWVNVARRKAIAMFRPKIEKPEEHWSVADRVAGYRFHD